MLAYIVRRLLFMIPTLFLVTVIVFGTIRFIPGSAIELMVAEYAQESGEGADYTAEDLRKALGLDTPIYIQYAQWIGQIVRLDLGESLWTGRNVIEDLGKRLPVTFELGIFALITALTMALPIGVYTAIRQDTAGDYIGRSIAILAICLPSFWLATLIIVFPSIWWGWSPPIDLPSLREDPMGNLKSFIIPGAVLGFALSGVTMRMTRAMMLEVLRQDYIRTAWAKGLKEKIVIIRHALKNALIPVITLIGLQVPILIGGTVVLEQIFVLPGMGLLMFEAVNQRDYPIITGLMLFMGMFILVINLVVDMSYGYLDPKVRYQ